MYEEFSAQVLLRDFVDGRGISKFPHGTQQGDAMDQLPNLVKQIIIYLEQQQKKKNTRVKQFAKWEVLEMVRLTCMNLKHVYEM